MFSCSFQHLEPVSIPWHMLFHLQNQQRLFLSFSHCVTLTLTLLSIVSDCWQPHGLQPARLLCPWNSPENNTGVGWHFLLQGHLPDPGIKPRSPALLEGSLLSEPLGKPQQIDLLSIIYLSINQSIYLSTVASFPTSLAQSLRADMLSPRIQCSLRSPNKTETHSSQVVCSSQLRHTFSVASQLLRALLAILTPFQFSIHRWDLDFFS